MTAKAGFIRYAISYLGGHSRYPEVCNAVAELSLAESSDQILNVYTNSSPAGFSPDPKDPMFAVPIRQIVRVANHNKSELSGAALIGGLGAVLQETRYILSIDCQASGIKLSVRFGSTMVVKSESYFKEFVKHLDTCMQQHRIPDDSQNHSSTNKMDIASQLEKLNLLKQQGALTEEEYSKAKSKLLDNQ